MSMYGGFEQVGALGIIKREYFFPQKGNTSITADVGKNIGFTKRATSSSFDCVAAIRDDVSGNQNRIGYMNDSCRYLAAVLYST